MPSPEHLIKPLGKEYITRDKTRPKRRTPEEREQRFCVSCGIPLIQDATVCQTCALVGTRGVVTRLLQEGSAGTFSPETQQNLGELFYGIRIDSPVFDARFETLAERWELFLDKEEARRHLEILKQIKKEKEAFLTVGEGAVADYVKAEKERKEKSRKFPYHHEKKGTSH